MGFASTKTASNSTASQIYARCYDLLRMSSNEAAFMDVFNVPLSTIQNNLSLTLRQKNLFGISDEIRNLLSELMVSILGVMKEIVACGPAAGSKRSSGISNFRQAVATVQDCRDRLLDAFWACQLLPDVLQYDNSPDQIPRLRDWLRPRDIMVRTIYANLQTSRTLPAEFTCEWFSKPLLEFIRSADKVFWIEGTIGCGKSTLYSWAIDSLQNQAGGHDYAVLNYTVDSRLSSETTILSLLKDLLRQAYDYNPGLTSLHIALMSAINTSVTPDYLQQISNALWNALDVVLQSATHPSIIVIDGLSDLSGGEEAINTSLERLLRGVSKSPMVRLLLMSRPLLKRPDIAVRQFAISSSQVYDDIRRIINREHPPGQLDQQHEVSSWILSRANGNFLWSTLTYDLWRSEQGQGFAVQFDSLPRSLDATLSLLISKIDFADPLVRLLILASVITVRPLGILEASNLLDLNMADRSFIRHDRDITEMVHQGCGSILTVNDGFIQFRHPLFKEAIHDFAKRRLGSSIPDLHLHMANRLLLYLRLVEMVQQEPSMTLLSASTIEDLFRSNQLLAYALQYWAYHLNETRASGDIQSFGPGSETMTVFPDNISISTLEASYWAQQRPYDADEALQVSAQTRRHVLGNHLATLQCTAFLALHLKTTDRLPEAAAAFATSFQSSQQLLPPFHDFTVSCASECLELLDVIADHDSLGLPFGKTDLLSYMVANYSQRSGPDSDRALEFTHLLARHYADTNQVNACNQTYRDIYRLTVDRHGKSSIQAQAVASDLTVAYQQNEQFGDQDQHDDLAYDDIVDMFAVTDGRRVKASMTQAAKLMSRNEPLAAELLYVETLHGITCQHGETDEDNRNLVNVGLLYASFLSERDRRIEAEGILLGLWTHLSGQSNENQVVDVLLEDIVLEAKRAGYPPMALKLIQSINERSKARDDDPVKVREIEGKISLASSELLESFDGSSVLPKSTEEALMRVFENAVTQGAPAMTTQFIYITQSLANSLILEQRWNDVVDVAFPVIDIVWPAALDVSSQYPSSIDFDPMLGSIGISLARAYGMIGEELTAAYIYRYILRSAKKSMTDHSQIIGHVAQAALDIFEKLGRIDDMIEIKREIVDYYQTSLGDDDALTLASSYSLASFCIEQGEMEIARPYYERIAATLKQGTYHDPRAIVALKALLVIFRKERSWREAEEIYHDLWQTFLEKGKEYSISGKTAKALFTGYSQLLKDEQGADRETLHRIREEYRVGCASAFGDWNFITLEASMLVAKSWQQQDFDSPDAILVYEAMLDGQHNGNVTLQPDSLGLIQQVESILLEYYQAHLDDEMDQATLSRATSLQKKQYVKDKASSGESSPIALKSLGYWVCLLTKDGSLQSRKSAIYELKQALTSVLYSRCDGKALLDAGTTLAALFVEYGYAMEGIDAARRLREQIVFSDAQRMNRNPLDDSHFLNRSKLTFVTAFETRMRGSLQGFMEIHCVTLLEAALSASFQASLQAQSSLEVVLTHGLRLSTLMKSHDSSYKDERLEQQMFTRFMESYGVAFTTASSAAFKFFLVLMKGLNPDIVEKDLPHLACIAVNREVNRLLDRREFSELIEIITAGFDFIHHVAAYGNALDVDYGFQLGIILTDRSRWVSSNQVAREQAFALSKSVLQEVLQLCRTNELDLDKISIDKLSKVAASLGSQESYRDLEVSIHLDRARDDTDHDIVATQSTVAFPPSTKRLESGWCYHIRAPLGRRPFLSRPCRIRY